MRERERENKQQYPGREREREREKERERQSAVIAVWLARQPTDRWFESLALALILGGALGNLYDRVTLGYVVDFLDFHWSGHHFPAFNVADSGISVGAVMLIIDGFINSDREKNSKSTSNKKS